MLGFYNDDIYVLTNSEIRRYNSNLSLIGSANISGGMRLEINSNGEIYVVTEVAGQTDNHVVKFDSSLNVIWSFSTQSHFTGGALVHSVSSHGGSVAIGGHTGVSTALEMWIAELDNLNGSVLWAKQSSQVDASMNGSFDLTYSGISGDRIVFASGFIPTNTQWVIDLDNKQMKGQGVYTPEPDKNIVVSELFNILTGNPTFKMGIESTGIYVSPNPATKWINISSLHVIEAIQVVNAAGQLVSKVNGVGSTSCSLDCSELDPGVYFVRVFSRSETSTVRLLKN